MSDMPERICAYSREGGSPGMGATYNAGWYGVEDPGYLPRGQHEAEYIRADIVAEKDAEIQAAKELLAILHGDGGHHTNDVGFILSCKDAMQNHWANRVSNDATDAEIERLRKALDDMFLMFEEARKDSQRVAVIYSYSGDRVSEDHQDAKCKRLADFAAAYLRERAAKEETV